ncbi:hypothetical protein [Prescottella agglutinans]|uniref:Secreted protein n=1 Tax=Prescottella agglutinans TaxID=1644129 RepID=A0ABT6MIW4_9NOCA|nr:hypothetical protein [Prescottella agglutinans]MDH6284266.1 hypothetical protein [Prescottella agglutinans]
MSARLKKIAAAAATTAAAAAAVALAAPATASAVEVVDVKPPTVKASSAGTTINMSITNPHKLLDAVGCNAMVVNAADVPAVVTNPLKLLEPGVVVFPNFTNFDSLFGVMPGQSKTYAVKDVKPGLYGIVGACASLWNVGEAPTITTPQMLAVINSDLGSVGSSEIPAFGS